MSAYRIGQYIPIYWDDADDDHPEYVRGHVADAQAREALNAWARGMGDGQLTFKHCYGRFVFAGAGADYDRELRTYDKPQRGAFALTEIRADERAKAATRGE